MGSASKQKGIKRLHSLAALSNSYATQSQDTRKDPHTTVVGGDPSLLRNDADAHRDDGSDNDAEACNLALDGAAEDEMLKGADALTEEEVIRRRARRVKQLMRLYRMQYWGLLEELRSKYRVFYLKHGRGGWKDDIDGEKDRVETMECFDMGNIDNPRSRIHEGAVKEGTMKEPYPPRMPSEMIRCATQACKAKPLALSLYCFAHILSDPRQLLYKACTHVTRSGQSGSVTCGKPVLRSANPSFCSMHLQKQATRRKANSAVAAAASKPAPKLHLVIAEYVRFIQSKRRASKETASKLDISVPNNKDHASPTANQHDQTVPAG